MTRQDFEISPPRKAKTMALVPMAWDSSHPTTPVISIENLWIRVKRSPKYHKRVAPLLNIGALVKYMTAGPALMLVLEGNQAVAVVKKLVGETEPATSDVGTIRGDYTMDSYNIASIDDRAVRNLIHSSDVVPEAQREIDLWFTKAELLEYRLIAEEILYDVNLDGILE